MKIKVGYSFYYITLFLIVINIVVFVYKSWKRTNSSTEVQIEEKTIDFGKIHTSDTVVATFKIKNIGQEDLIISDVKASCGCTVPSWTSEPILTGEKAEVLLSYDISDVGLFQKSVSVFCNTKESPIILLIRGQVISNDNSNY